MIRVVAIIALLVSSAMAFAPNRGPMRRFGQVSGIYRCSVIIVVVHTFCRIVGDVAQFLASPVFSVLSEFALSSSYPIIFTNAACSKYRLAPKLPLLIFIILDFEDAIGGCWSWRGVRS